MNLILRATLCRLALPLIFICSIAIGSVAAQVRDTEPKMPVYVFGVWAKLTAYDACTKCCGKVNGKTKMGTDGRTSTGVAAANNLVPLGAQVRIEGLAENPVRLVDDTGGGMRRMARKGYLQFDIRFGGKNAHRRAEYFGVKWDFVLVYIQNPDATQLAFFRKNAKFIWNSPTLDVTEAFLGAQEQFAMITD